MIQRIQTLWLILAAFCMVLCLLFPVAKYHADMTTTGQQLEAELDLIAKDNPEMMNQMVNMEPVVNYSQKMSGFKTWPLIAMVAVCGVMALCAMFMYKNRMRQLLLVSIVFIINVVYVFLVFFWAVDSYADTFQQAMGVKESVISWQAGAYMPLASLIFFVLAQRGIKKDEAKVRAADRLR